MNYKIKTSWDLSEYYSGLEDEKFLSDWNFFLQISNNFIKNYSMKIPTFHTYNDLMLFYKDFEEVIKYYENLRYFLHYKNSLNIFDEKILAKISEIEEISGNFLISLWELYQIFYTKTSPEFKKSLQKYWENDQNEYHYTIKKFLEELEFYKNCDKEFFILKSQIENDIRYFLLLQEQNQVWFYNKTISREDFVKNSCKNYFNLITLRTEFLSFSRNNTVAEQFFAEMWFSFSDAVSLLSQVSESEEIFHLQKEKFLDIDISLEDVVLLLEKVFSENFPNAKDFFIKMLQDGDFDFYPSDSKSPISFTSFHKGKDPKILLQFSEKFSDIANIIHEFWHAYQMKKSESIPLLEIMPSPFMSEFSASFFEKILENYYQKNWEFSQEFSRMKAKKCNTLVRAYQSAIFEQSCYNGYLWGQFSSEELFEFWLRENDFYTNAVEIFSQSHIFQSPFYMVAYIFAIILAEKVSKNPKKFEIFEKIISQGGSKSVKDIFLTSGIDISLENFYSSEIPEIFS